jgi:sodium/potassium-transporting ATPase subunit alpha
LAQPALEKHRAARELSELDWHRLPLDEVLQRLNVSPKAGLDAEQVKRRQAAGMNEMTPPPRNLLRKWLSYVFGGFGSILFIGGVLCFIAWRPLGDPNPAVANLALAVILLLVIVIQTAFNAWQDWSTSRVMASITGMLPQEVTVVRDGSPQTVLARELVAGDIVQVGLGNKLPADIRFLSSADMKFDRSVLTGESEPVSASLEMTDANILESRNIGLQGTLCVSGSGTGVVFQTGDSTVFGRIAKLSSTGGPRQTTLEKEIFSFVLIIVGFALSIALLVIILWAAWLNREHHGFITPPTLVISVVSVCVAFIPEGLPVSITISLKVVANALARRKVLCKTLMTVETLGSVSVLCSDKTGTLTSNLMTVTNAAVLDDEMTSLEAADRLLRGKDDGRVAQLAAIAALCNGAQFEVSDKETRVNGDATDAAILRFADALRPVDESNADWAEVYKAAFSSKTKFMLRLLRATTHRPAPISPSDPWSADSLMLTVKGAPDVLLKRCAYIATSAGIEDLTPANLARLTVVGLVGLVDPPRDDIPETVRTLRGAGIRFFMVTGDFATTAVAIAEQCGIVTSAAHIHSLANLDRNADPAAVAPYDPDDADAATRALVLSGPELMEMNDAQWAQACAYAEIVFARTTPDQKLRIVREFQARACIVGMTGDGVNDAPSLKAANVGIAMGSGSDVAIEAADLVLLDSFSSMVTAVTYGRLVFDNLKKTILYLLPAGSFSELMPILLNVLIGVPQMLSSIQMIIICCVRRPITQHRRLTPAHRRPPRRGHVL